MAVPTDQVSAPVSPRPDSHPVPVTRPRGRLVFLLSLPVAAAAGLAAGAWPQTALAVIAAVVSAAVLIF